MGELLSFFTMRSVILFASTAFSIMFVMLLLNIITVDEVVVMLKMSPEAANAFKLIISRVQEVSSNIFDIISQLLNKLLGWTGADIDLSKIKIDVNKGGSALPIATDPHHNGGRP
jgi:hypothetical protein